MLRLEMRNAETPIERKPEWIKTKAKMGPEYRQLQSLVKSEDLHTVCQEAGCPNIFECWEDREATFLIGGSQCTRRCDFCQIDTGKPADYDTDEPRRVAESVVADEPALRDRHGRRARRSAPTRAPGCYAETIREIHAAEPRNRRRDPRDRLLGQPGPTSARSSPRGRRSSRTTSRRSRASSSASGPRSVTSARSTCSRRGARPGSSRSRTSSSGWARSATRSARRCRTCTTPEPTSSRSRSTCGPSPGTCLWRAGCIRTSSWRSRQEAEEIGFLGVLAGPLVRSSYRAGRLWAQSMQAKGRAVPEELQHLADASLGFAQAVS